MENSEIEAAPICPKKLCKKRKNTSDIIPRCSGRVRRRPGTYWENVRREIEESELVQRYYLKTEKLDVSLRENETIEDRIKANTSIYVQRHIPGKRNKKKKQINENKQSIKKITDKTQKESKGKENLPVISKNTQENSDKNTNLRRSGRVRRRPGTYWENERKEIEESELVQRYYLKTEKLDVSLRENETIEDRVKANTSIYVQTQRHLPGKHSRKKNRTNENKQNVIKSTNINKEEAEDKQNLSKVSEKLQKKSVFDDVNKSITSHNQNKYKVNRKRIQKNSVDIKSESKDDEKRRSKIIQNKSEGNSVSLRKIKFNVKTENQQHFKKINTKKESSSPISNLYITNSAENIQNNYEIATVAYKPNHLSSLLFHGSTENGDGKRNDNEIDRQFNMELEENLVDLQTSVDGNDNLNRSSIEIKEEEFDFSDDDKLQILEQIRIIQEKEIRPDQLKFSDTVENNYSIKIETQ